MKFQHAIFNKFWRGGISIGRIVALQAKGFQFKSEFLHLKK